MKKSFVVFPAVTLNPFNFFSSPSLGNNLARSFVFQNNLIISETIPLLAMME